MEHQQSVIEQSPLFETLKVYVKHMSFEAPHVSYTSQNNLPTSIDVDVNVAFQSMENDIYEVILQVVIMNKTQGKATFLLEIIQSGFFRVKNISEKEINKILNTRCPSLLLLEVREMISNLISLNGFKPFHLNPVDFEAAYHQQIEQTPKTPDQLLQHAMDLYQKGDKTAAKKVCLHWLANYPDQSDILDVLGTIYTENGFFKTARRYLERCLQLKENANYFNHLGIVYQNLRHVTEAESNFLKAIAMDSNHIDAHVNLGIMLCQHNRLKEAYQYFQVIEYFNCRRHDYLYFYSQVKFSHCEFQAAKKLLLKSLRLKQKKSAVLYALALVYYYEGNVHQAISILERGLKDKETNIINDEFKELLAFCYLSIGDSIKGWDLHGYRETSISKRKWLATQGCDLPFWQGETQPECNLLIIAEEGIGDELLYTTFLDVLKNKVNRIYLECDQRLKPLFERTYQDIIFFDRNNHRFPKEIAHQCNQCVLMGELTHYLNPTMDMKYTHTPLLPDKNRSQVVRNKLLQLHPHKILIGIAYHTSAKNAQYRMPPLDFWEDIFQSNEHIAFINLQENDQTKPGKRSFLYDHPLLYHIDDLDLYNDIDDLAALIDATDFIVSIGNYVAHLAGRLTKPTIVVLSNLGNPRWFLTTSDNTSLWYPTVQIIKDTHWLTVKNKVAQLMHQKHFTV